MAFDYIIAGAGSAGCVLADRLSRDGTSRVLLLESGGTNRAFFVTMPRGMAKIWRNPLYYWAFPAEPQPFRPAGETWYYGKGLGGSSAVNGTWYYRGQPDDFDQWEQQGNPGWNWATIERAYKAIEDYREPGAHASRGVGGPLTVIAARDESPLTQAILEAGRQSGLPVLEDVNEPGTHGLGPTQMTVGRDGRRVTAATAFLRDAAKRPNLEIRTGVTVKRVLFEDDRAVGVVCEEDGRETIDRAARDVILCAGVLQSPKLLQLSGIGPGADLAELGIPVVVDNPAVGRNMTEHMMLSLSFRLNAIPGNNREFRGWRLYANTLRYIVSRSGIMATLLPNISIMLSTQGNARWPDMQLAISPYSMTNSPGNKTEAGRGVPDATPGITMVGFHLRPKSRGTVSLRSADVADPPRLAANWLAEPEDRDTLVDMVKTMRALIRQPALADYIGAEITPGEAVQSNAEIMKAAEHLLSTGLHGTGTCRMGPSADAGIGSVVDPRLRVHGVRGLRVVDCSVMPTAIAGNTNGPAMAVAWHAANLILEDRDAG